MTWITVRTTNTRWQSEFMQQLLADYDIPSRVLDVSLGGYFGQNSQIVLQVRSQDQWTALLLLSAPEDDES